MHQDPDIDRYTSDEKGPVVDHATDELELIAVSKRPNRIILHATVVRTNLEPKISCVKTMDDAHVLELVSGQLNVWKTSLKARYRLSDLSRAQRIDRMTNHLKRWIENGVLDKCDLEEENYKILKRFYMKRK